MGRENTHRVGKEEETKSTSRVLRAGEDCGTGGALVVAAREPFKKMNVVKSSASWIHLLIQTKGGEELLVRQVALHSIRWVARQGGGIGEGKTQLIHGEIPRGDGFRREVDSTFSPSRGEIAGRKGPHSSDTAKEETTDPNCLEKAA